MQYLQDKMESDAQRREDEHLASDSKNSMNVVKSIFDSAGLMVNQLLATIPYFRRRQEKAAKDKIVLEATKSIYRMADDNDDE